MASLPHNHSNNIDDIISKLPNTDDFLILSDLFRQLSDQNRIRIFWLLCHCEECVINLSALMDMSSPAISHHLKQLKSAGLIVSRRSGKEVYYKAADSDTARALHNMIEALMTITCPETCLFK